MYRNATHHMNTNEQNQTQIDNQDPHLSILQLFNLVKKTLSSSFKGPNHTGYYPAGLF